MFGSTVSGVTVMPLPVLETWQRAEAVTAGLLRLAGSGPLPQEIDEVERQAVVLYLRLNFYILVAGPQAPVSPSPAPVPEGTPAALGSLLSQLGHTLSRDTGEDPVAAAWTWLTDHNAFAASQTGAERVIRCLADQAEGEEGVDDEALVAGTRR